MADWYLVTQPNDGGGIDVWLSDAPDADGQVNGIIVGGGLTRRAALLSAHKELLAQAARVAWELSEPEPTELPPAPRPHGPVSERFMRHHYGARR